MRYVLWIATLGGVAAAVWTLWETALLATGAPQQAAGAALALAYAAVPYILARAWDEIQRDVRDQLRWREVGAAPVVTLAVVVGLLVAFLVFGQRRPDAIDPPGVPAPAAQATKSEPIAVAPAEKWSLSRWRSPVDDSETVSVSRVAESDFRGRYDSERGVLFLQCADGRIDVAVDVGMMAERIEGDRSERSRVRMRLDGAKPVVQRWRRNEDYLIANSPKQLVGELVASERLLFAFTPYRAGETHAEFDLRGLGAKLSGVQEECGIQVQETKGDPGTIVNEGERR